MSHQIRLNTVSSFDPFEITKAKMSQHVQSCATCKPYTNEFRVFGDKEISTLRVLYQRLSIQKEYEATLSRTMEKLLPLAEKISSEYCAAYDGHQAFLLRLMAECALKADPLAKV
jgi:hypothetical protein